MSLLKQSAARVARTVGTAFLLSGLHAASAQYVISTIAGGAPPPTPVAAVSASIGSPFGVVVDSVGNTYFTSDNCVFKVDAKGIMARVAGTSRAGYSGDGFSASNAQLSFPSGIAVYVAGNVYVADTFNDRIRKVSLNGVITTVAGDGTSAQLDRPHGVTLDADGNLYVADSGSVRKISQSGIITIFAALGPGDELSFPSGMVFDTAGNLYIADYGNNLVRKVSASGVITTFAGGGTSGLGDGGPATSAQLSGPNGVAVDASGSVYITDSGRIRKISQTGVITTVAGGGALSPGDGGPATSATLSPTGVALDSSGNIYIADYYDNRIREVTPSGIITTAAGDGNFGYSGDGGPATSAQLGAPYGVAVDTSGNFYIADYYDNRIRKVSPGGIITTLAGDGTFGFSGDGGPATGARLSEPHGAAVDSSGNVFVADYFRVRKISSGGTITTVAGNGFGGFAGDGGQATNAELGRTSGVAVDPTGNLYIADDGNRIRKVDPGGIITTVAGNGTQGYSGDGGLASSAQLNQPAGVAVDAAGNLYIADSLNDRIRMVSPSGIIMTIAGNGTVGYSGDGGAAINAKLGETTGNETIFPQGLAVDTAGNVYVADTGNSAIRLLRPLAPTPSIGAVTNGASNIPRQ